MASSKAGVPVNAGSRWDGTTSDLAQQLNRRFKVGDSVPQRKYAALPDAIQKRLKEANTTFDKLPGLLQRALLWDSGYVENGNTPDELVRVQTLDGVSMAEIAVSLKTYQDNATCSAQSCTQSDGVTWYKNKKCDATPMLAVTNCMVDSFESGDDPHLAMWSTGGVDTTIPAIRLLKHKWVDLGIFNEVAAIHTAEAAAEPDYAYCSTTSKDTLARGVGSLIVPCESSGTISATRKDRMKEPQPGKIVTAWLQQYASTIAPSSAPVVSETPAPTQSEKGMNWIVIIAPAVGVVLVAVGIVLWCCRHRSRSLSEAEETQPETAENYQRPMATPYQPEIASLGTLSASKGLYHSGGDGTHSTGSSESRPTTHSLDGNTQAAYHAVAQMLRDDPRLADKQIPYEELELANQVSQGAYGEVWVGYWNREIVAIKRLLRAKHHTPRDVEAFAQEIQLSARLHHPNIVRFVGVAWNGAENLCMAMEYLPAGDLSKVLRESGQQFQWNQQKLSMARGLAGGVAYLHSQLPAIIHRDLKSKNVLLTTTLEPKLIDFGVSRRKMDDTMTAGVGTPYWTAPEVLEGLRYTEKSDIYSLGVLLTELDTCQIPYYDVPSNGGGMIHLKILNDVVSGKLRPSVTESCPEVIRSVIASCLRQDPAKRPTATEVLWMLA